MTPIRSVFVFDMDHGREDLVKSFQEQFADLASSLGFRREIVTRLEEDEIRVWTREAKGPRIGTIYLSAGMHGDESCTPFAAMEFLKGVVLREDCDWIVAPLLNPVGLRAGTRENGEGIDLNRDFLRRESQEVRSLITWWESRTLNTKQPFLHLSLHEDWEADGFYLYEIHTDGRSPVGRGIMDDLEREFPVQKEGPVDGHILSGPGLILHRPEPDEPEGWPEAIWLAKTYLVHSLTFEAPGTRDIEIRRTGLVAALAATMQRVLLPVVSTR